jgi:hypothetical protein
MSAYVPHDPATVGLSALILAGTLLTGFLLTRSNAVGAARLASWLVAILAVGSVERLTRSEPSGFRMLAIIGVLLWSMKAVVAVESMAVGTPRLPPLAWCAFTAGWFGMQPRLFVTLGAPPRAGAGELVWNGVRRLLVGLGCVVTAATIWAVGTVLPEAPRLLLATLVLLPGLSLVLHFGVFNILAGLWRFAGVACGPLFRAPLRSTSLGEFWGRRWNLAFAEMTAIAVYRPLAGRLGNVPALVGAFLISGLLHELAITVPIQTAYGLPMLYFLLHGSLVQVERWLERRGTPVNRVPWIGRVWTLAWLFLPLGVLFPPPFLQGVVWPIVGIEPARTR